MSNETEENQVDTLPPPPPPQKKKDDEEAVVDAAPAPAAIKKKRSAGNQLTKDDYDAGEGDCEVDGDEIIKQGFKRAPEDVLKGRKIYKINRTAFQSKTPAADSVTGTSVAATTNGTTATSSATTDNKNEVLLEHTRTRVETWVPTVSRKVFSDAFIAVLVLQLVASVVVFGIFALGFFFVGLLQIL